MQAMTLTEINKFLVSTYIIHMIWQDCLPQIYKNKVVPERRVSVCPHKTLQTKKFYMVDLDPTNTDFHYPTT